MKLRGWMIALALLAAACGGRSEKPAGTTADSEALTVQEAEFGDAPNVTRYGSLWFSGQPGAEDWAAARDKGIKRVIDLRNKAESRGHDEKQALRKLNLEYSVHPVREDDYSKATIQPVLDAMTKAQETGDGVLIHCASSNRSGALFAIWRYQQGDSLEQAIKLGKQAGMSSEERNARKYIEDHGR